MFEQTCPSHAQLSGFVLGTLPVLDLERVARHLDSCPDCEAVVEALEHLSDPVVAAIRHPGVGSTLLPGQPAGANRPPVPERLGDFRILREIGRGGMGVVYEAEQVSLGRHVAVKVLPRHALLELESLERFRRESRAAAGLHHTNIVQVFGTGEHDGLHYYVMQLIPGVGLDKALRELKQSQAGQQPSAASQRAARSGPSLPDIVGGLFFGTPSQPSAEIASGRHASEAHPDGPPGSSSVTSAPSSSGSGRAYWLGIARVGAQVADALQYAHAYGVIHRDIKPSNLLLDPRGTIWVTDFGLAKSSDALQTLTQSGDIIGTVRYMAPERFDGKSDARGDVYSLGVTLYELLTLRDAYPDTDRNVLLRRKLDVDPPRPRRLNPEVPRDLETIVLKAIARDRAHRYQTAGDLASDLRRFLEDRPVRARRITAPERLWRWCRRDPRTAGLLAALLCALTAGLLGVAKEWRRAEGKARDEAVARASADAAKEEAKSGLYLSDVAQTRLEWRLNNVASAERLLDECEPARRGWEWHYLRGVNRAELATLSSPELAMTFGVAFSPDGRLLAFTGWDYYKNNDGHAPTPVVIYDVPGGKQVQTLSVRGVGLRPVFSPDSRLLAACGPGQTVQLRDVATGKAVQNWDEKGLATFSPDGRLLAVGGPTAVTVREITTGRLVHRIASRGGRVCYSPDGQLLAVSGRDAIELRSAATGQEVGRLPHGPGDKLDLYFPELGPDLAFSPDGKLLVTATSPPRLWDVAARRPLTTLGGHAGIVPGVAFSPDGRQIATAGADTTVRLWDAQTGSELAVLRGHTGVAACVAFHPDGWSLASGGRQPGDVKLWDLTRHPEHLTLDGGGPQAMAFDANGRLTLLTIVGRVQSHEPESGLTQDGPLIDLPRKFLSPVKLAAFSGDGRLLAAVSADLRTVKVFEAATGRELAALRGLEALPIQVALSDDGRRVAATTRATARGPARAVLACDVATGHHLARFRPAPAPPPYWHGAVALSPDGSRLAFDDYSDMGARGAVGSVRARVRVCDPAAGNELLAVAAGDGGISCLAFSPDGLLLVAGGWDGTFGRILVWDAASGRRRCEGRLDFAPLSLAFNPGSRRVAAVGREGVAICDVSTGKGILTLRGAPPRPTDLGSNAALAWSHDGRWLAASNWDGTVAVWDGNTAESPPLKQSLRQVPESRVYAWHLGQAEAALAARQPAAAAFHLSRVSATAPPDLPSRYRRGRLSLRRRDWESAAADYAAVFSAGNPDGSTAWLEYARVLVLRGDLPSFRGLIPRMLAHCGGKTDLGNPEGDEARVCVLAPGALTDPAEAVPRAERVVKDSRDDNAAALLSLALAHYRAGDWEKALARTEDAIARSHHTPWLGWPVLAMAHARMGHTVEARRWLEKAEDWQRQESRRVSEESFGFAPPEWADFEILKREAAALISRPDP